MDSNEEDLPTEENDSFRNVLDEKMRSHLSIRAAEIAARIAASDAETADVPETADAGAAASDKADPHTSVMRIYTGKPNIINAMKKMMSDNLRIFRKKLDSVINFIVSQCLT